MKEQLGGRCQESKAVVKGWRAVESVVEVAGGWGQNYTTRRAESSARQRDVGAAGEGMEGDRQDNNLWSKTE